MGNSLNVSIPKRGFGGFSLIFSDCLNIKVTVSIPKRGFGGFSQFNQSFQW